MFKEPENTKQSMSTATSTRVEYLRKRYIPPLQMEEMEDRGEENPA